MTMEAAKNDDFLTDHFKMIIFCVQLHQFKMIIFSIVLFNTLLFSCQIEKLSHSGNVKRAPRS